MTTNRVTVHRSLIQLHDIEIENIKECLALEVSTDQKSWDRSVSYSLSLAYVHGEAAVPFAINDDKIIEPVMLRYNKELNNFLYGNF